MISGSELNKKRRGIMGGTFDPVHLGHIHFADAAIAEAGLGEIIFMPAYIQPFKRDRYVADGNDRLRMLELATMHEARFRVSSWELEQETVSYTFDTISNIHEQDPNQRVYFLLGSDAMMKIERWNRGSELLNICNLVVGLRPEDDRTLIRELAKKLSDNYGTEIVILESEMLNISSTMVRERVAAGHPINGLVSQLVEEYIYENKLYV